MPEEQKTHVIARRNAPRLDKQWLLWYHEHISSARAEPTALTWGGNCMQETLTARPCGLRMNLRREPWGMPADPAAWRFSWCPPEGQSACRLTIFRGVPDEDPVPLYDTGWMSCTRSTGVSLPAGECPTPEAGLYGWQVRIRDRSGNESRSEVQPFSVFDAAAWRTAHGIWPSTPDCLPDDCNPAALCVSAFF